ncbi:MAG: hypothetical protein MH137_08385 [Flavobacteriales bacterium]|nr:hypothetical protein [Flavobacteriales bacterium]
MHCTNCFSQVESNMMYCPQCGKPTVYNTFEKGYKPGEIALWVYLIYSILVMVVYRTMSYVVSPMLSKQEEGWSRIASIYNTLSPIILITQLAVLVFIMVTVKNTRARIAVGIYTALVFIFFVTDKLVDYLQKDGAAVFEF